MAERGTTKGGSAGGTGTLDRNEEESDRNTGTTRLKEELEDYIEARLSVMLQGVGHGLGEGARKLLEWEGFSFSNVIDIFDGGPLVSARRDQIRTKREARLVRVAAGANLEGAKRALIAVPRLKDYRCVSARVARGGDAHAVDAATFTALGLKDGDEALVWIDDAH